MTDPLVEEARRAGQAYVESFGGDLRAVVADLRRRSREAGRSVVSLPPKRPDADRPPHPVGDPPPARRAG